MEHLFTSESIISFVILVILEVVLGIDNVIFVSIVMNRLKKITDQKKARRIWMITGIISRSLLLMALGWLLSQQGKSVLTIGGKGFDLASLVMLAGGLFLIYKSVMEIHHKLEGEDPNAENKNKKPVTLGQAIGQIIHYHCRWYGRTRGDHDCGGSDRYDDHVPLQPKDIFFHS
jgi:predicted tellurium resistance membrane protein TerC